ncbi:MAG TPA: hypothetical protein VKK81_05030 [Candidatus Binatia bacterium]|nr:hypothetical protein [Candidatus Binatia bacterium]
MKFGLLFQLQDLPHGNRLPVHDPDALTPHRPEPPGDDEVH